MLLFLLSTLRLLLTRPYFTQTGLFFLLLIALFAGSTSMAKAGVPTILPPTESKPTSADCNAGAFAKGGINSICVNETIELFTSLPNQSHTWIAPAGATLDNYTKGRVTASFTTSGPKTFTATPQNYCPGVITIMVNPAPDITIFFPNSQPLVPISDGLPTVTQIILPNNIQATQGVLYEWSMVIERINGYEIRQGDSNGTGMFRVSRVGPYLLTVTGANSCKRTVRGVLASPP